MHAMLADAVSGKMKKFKLAFPASKRFPGRLRLDENI
jgi:hypothetical protein